MTLSKKYIVVTNDELSAQAFALRLQSFGAHVIFAPCIKITDPICFVHVDRCIERLASFTHVIFTSQNAVRFLAKRMMELGYHNQHWAHLAMAAVGAKTAETVYQLFGPKLLCQGNQGASSLMTQLALSSKNTVFFPKSNLALETVEKYLLENQIPYQSAETYRVVKLQPSLSSLSTQPIDAVCFFSPSAVMSLSSAGRHHDLHQKILSKAIVACIGATTAECARLYGYQNIVVAQQPEAQALIETLSESFLAKT